MSNLNLLLRYETKSNVYYSQLKHLLGISIPTISGPGELSKMEKYILKWEGFSENIVNGIKRERHGNDFVDVSLAVKGGKVVHAHKIVLSLGSKLFRAILKENSHSYPMVFLSDVSFDDLLGVLDFIYSGEVEISEDKLNSFLKVCEDLGVEGFKTKPADTEIPDDTQFDVNDYLALGSDSVKSSISKSSSVNGEVNGPVTKRSKQSKPSALQNCSPSATPAPRSKSSHPSTDKSTTPVEVLRGEELNAKLQTFCIKLGFGKLQCSRCNRNFDNMRKLMFHVETHLHLSFPCTLCDKDCPTRYSLAQHCKNKHNKDIGNPLKL